MKTERGSLSDFVRKHLALDIAEIVEQARREGLPVTAGLVYAVRSAEKRKRAGEKLNARQKPPPATRPISLPPSDLSQRFAELAVEIGFARSNAILSNVRRTLVA